MATLAEIRQQYPQYQDMPDAVLADKLHQKFYSDMPRAEFDAKIGLAPAPAPDATSLDTPWGPGTGSLTAYDPSQRDRLSVAAQNAGLPREAASSILGSSGLGPEIHGTKSQPIPGMGLIDMTGLGIPLSINEAQRSANSGEVTGNPLDTLATMDIPGTVLNSLSMIPGAKMVTGITSKALPEAVEAGRRLGISVPRAVSSDSILAQRAGQATSKFPAGSTQLVKANEKTVEGLADTVENAAKTYGKGTIVDTASAGQTARKALTTTIEDTTTAKVTKAYDAVDPLVNKNVTGPLASTNRAAVKILTDRHAAGLTDNGGAVDTVYNALLRPGGLTYEGTKRLRTEVREILEKARRGHPLPGGMDKTELQTIYDSLGDDLRATIEKAGGPEALAKWERANKYAALVAQRRKDLMQILGASSDEGVIGRIKAAAGTTNSANASLLLKARKAVPADEWDDIVSGIVADLGKGRNGFSTDVFVTNYRQKLTDQGRSILFGSTGHKELTQALDDVATVSARYKEIFAKYGNPSGTAQNLGAMAQIGMIAGAIMSGDFSGVVATVGGPNIAARILSKPSTARSYSRWIKAQTNALQTPSAAAGQVVALQSRALAAELGRELGWTAEQVKQLAASLAGGDAEPANAGDK
jgi:hypothetical protein